MAVEVLTRSKKAIAHQYWQVSLFFKVGPQQPALVKARASRKALGKWAKVYPADMERNYTNFLSRTKNSGQLKRSAF